MIKSNPSKWAIRPLVPEEVYTDRQEYIDYLYNSALKAITRWSMSTVLLGQRRMGKTEIFKRVVNRLFFEQDSPEDPEHSVVPVYFSFPDTVVDKWVFCTKYVENFTSDLSLIVNFLYCIGLYTLILFKRFKVS